MIMIVEGTKISEMQEITTLQGTEYIPLINSEGNKKTSASVLIERATPTIGANGNWYVNGEDTGKPSRGETGVNLGDVELAQELSTKEGSEKKAISQKAVSEALNNNNNTIILEWNTDVATTRKQVLLQERKKLLQISYENSDGKVINEQYIGTTFTDTEWVKDSNWERIPNQTQISELQNGIYEINNKLLIVASKGYFEIAWQGGEDKTKKYYYNSLGQLKTDSLGYYGAAKIDVSLIIGSSVKINTLCSDGAYNLFVKEDGTVIEKWQQDGIEETEKIIPTDCNFLLLSNIFYNSSLEEEKTNPTLYFGAIGEKIYNMSLDINKINNNLYVDTYDIVWKGGKEGKGKYFYDMRGLENNISDNPQAGFYGIAKIDVSNIIGQSLTILSYANLTAYNLFVKDDGTVIEKWHASSEAEINVEVVKIVPQESKYLLLTNLFSLPTSGDQQLNPYVKKFAIVKEFPSIKEKAEFAYDFIKTGGNANQWDGKIWYAYGTSLTNITNEGKYAKYLRDLSGLTLVNKGLSGGKIVNNGNIKQAVMNTTDGKLEADLITLEVGANDAPATLGDVYDEDDTTFCGALNQCIRYLQENTNAQIVVLSSTTSRYKLGDPSQKYNGTEKFGSDEHTVLQMRQKTREVCELNSCYYIPMGEGCGLGYARMNASNLYNYDQIHHTDLGGYNVAQFIWSRLKNIPLWYISITE